jgi:hypothetical protein
MSIIQLEHVVHQYLFVNHANYRRIHQVLESITLVPKVLFGHAFEQGLCIHFNLLTT